MWEGGEGVITEAGDVGRELEEDDRLVMASATLPHKDRAAEDRSIRRAGRQ